MIKAIETYYEGRRFRSRLEARWAVFFDTLGIKWIYEPEGIKLSDGTCYLPDFYLPESDSFFEVKGLMTGKDKHKIEQLIRDTDKCVTIGYDNCEFEATDENGCNNKEIVDREYSRLYRCGRCETWFFHGFDCFYLPCCGETSWEVIGAFDDASGVDNRECVLFNNAVACGNGCLTKGGAGEYWMLGDEYKKAKNAFLSARFEHGEAPA